MGAVKSLRGDNLVFKNKEVVVMDEHVIEPIPNPSEFVPLTREQFVAGFDAAMEADKQSIPDERLEPFRSN